MSTRTTNSVVGSAIADAVAQLRADAQDPTASILVLAPSAVNGTLARREYAAMGPFIRVSFSTPQSLYEQLAHGRALATGLRSEPAGWLRTRLADIIHSHDCGRYTRTLRDPGWFATLTAATTQLEAAALEAADLKAAAAAMEGDLAERARLFAVLLEHLASARDADGLLSPNAHAAHALASCADATPINTHQGVVILGDTHLPRTVHRALRAFLAARPVRTVAATDGARYGMVSAAPHALEVSIETASPSVEFVRTPDPMREVREAVRVTQAAVVSGTAMNRIAIVLPDAAEAPALAQALEAAALPSTWQTGEPLSLTPATRFLMLWLRIVAGEDTVATWHELLTLPGLRLRSQLEESATQGRGRWRRLLGKCGGYRGTAKILRALNAYEQERLEALDDERREDEAAAFASLSGAITALMNAIDMTPKTIGDWAGLFAQLLRDWWVWAPDQRVLVHFMEEWRASDVGVELPLGGAIELFDEALNAKPYLRGSLKDASVRVLSPMQLLGGEFDLVCATGLTQGRFPTLPKQDPLLTDELVDALEERFEAGLFRSDDRIALERRRFSALRHACRERLWLSSPAIDLAGGRPLLASTLSLELASHREGRSVGYADFDELQMARGRRARPFAEDPSDALGAQEYLLSRLARGEAMEPLVDHPWARRLVRLARATTRLGGGERSDELRAYAGFVPPELIDALGGESVAPRALAMLYRSPAEFFYKHVLGAYRATALRESFDPLAKWYAPACLAKVAETALESSRDLQTRLSDEFDAAAQTEMSRAGHDDDDVAKRVERRGHNLAAALLALDPVTGPQVPMEDVELGFGMPWRLSGVAGRRLTNTLEFVSQSAPGARSPHYAAAEFIALAALSHGGGPTEIRILGTEGQSFKSSLKKHGEALLAQLEEMTQHATRGYFGGSVPPGVGLEFEPTLDATPESAAFAEETP